MGWIVRFFLIYISLFSVAHADPLRYLSKTVPDHTDFENVSTEITNSSLDDGNLDDGYQELSLGFNFHFNGSNYSSVFIDTNGRVIFMGETDFTNDDLSDSNTESGMYPYWDDLDARNYGKIKYGHLGSGSSERFIIWWDDVSKYRWGGGRNGHYSTQVVIYKDGKIRFRYKDGDDADGDDATIGVKEDDSHYDQHLKDSDELDSTKDILYTPTTISGNIYEDPNGDSAMSDKIAKASATVYLYDSGGILLDTNITDSNGEYLFHSPVAETVYVVADSKTIAPVQSFNSGYDQSDIWAEQSYGGVGAECADGSGGTTSPRSSAGSCFGGRRGDVSDDASTLDDAEHRIEITTDTSTSSYIDRDFGFSFNVVTSIKDGSSDASSSMAQGTLRQFILNANALDSANYMRFVPAVAKNGIGSKCWKITLSDDMNETKDDETTVDGIAYSLSDGTTVDNSNSGSISLAVSTVGTGADALEGTGDEHLIVNYKKQELEIDAHDKNAFNITGDDNLVKRLSIYNASTAIKVSGKRNKLNMLLLGTRADGSDPGGGDRASRAVSTTTGANGTILKRSYIAYVVDTAVYFPTTGAIRNNYFLSNAIGGYNQDAISLEGNGAKRLVKVWYNYIDGAGGYGIESWYAGGGFSIENNTITNTGSVGSDELGGIRIFGEESSVIYNIISHTKGAGVAVVKNHKNIISKNAIYSNDGLSIDLDQTGGTNPDGDGVTPNDGALDSAKQNNDIDYPILSKVTYDGSTLHIEGFVGSAEGQSAFANAKLEIYISNDDGNNNGEIIFGDGKSEPHGEGKSYLFECSADGDGNIDCDYSSSTLDKDIKLTLTATLDSEGTSEFGANYPIILYPKMHFYKTSIVTYDPVNGATHPKRIPGATIRYCMTVDNNGSGDAEDTTVGDKLSGNGKDNLSYVKSGSVVQDIADECNCSALSTTNGTISGTDVTVNIGDINGTNDTAHSRGCVYIETELE